MNCVYSKSVCTFAVVALLAFQAPAQTGGRAALHGRDFVKPDDVKHVAVPALAHRLTLAPELWVQRTEPAEIVGSILASVAAPVADEIEP